MFWLQVLLSHRETCLAQVNGYLLQYRHVSGAFQYRHKLQTITVEQCCKICGPDLSQGLLQPCQQHSHHIRYESTLPFEQSTQGVSL